jgi:hypothetical protein
MRLPAWLSVQRVTGNGKGVTRGVHRVPSSAVGRSPTFTQRRIRVATPRGSLRCLIGAALGVLGRRKRLLAVFECLDHLGVELPHQLAVAAHGGREVGELPVLVDLVVGDGDLDPGVQGRMCGPSKTWPVKAAIAAITEDRWTAIRYPRAIWEP